MIGFYAKGLFLVTCLLLHMEEMVVTEIDERSQAAKWRMYFFNCKKVTVSRRLAQIDVRTVDWLGNVFLLHKSSSNQFPQFKKMAAL